MSDVQLYLLAVEGDKLEAQKIAARSAEGLTTKQLKLIDLVASLEEYINNKDNGTLRAKAVTYLADVLSQLQPRVLSGQERRLLSDFLLGRIEGDLEGIGASAKALIAIEALGKWDTETSQKVMQTFINHTSPLRQFKLQTERSAVVQLLDVLLAKYRKSIRQLHEEDPNFIARFIMYFEGEKDPRNLMIIFSLLQVPMTEWDIHANAQDMFEAVFNYFPITFNPPPDDPYGITAQDLKDRLRSCIAADPDFAPYAFPQLLDKLDSTSMNTKRDVIKAIQACVVNYDSKTINLYSVTLWDALKFEILNVQEEDLAEESLRALSLIASKFSESAEGPLTAYLRSVIKECNEHLEDAPTKQSEAAGRVLHELAKASPATADRIAKGVLPVLFALFQASDSITKRRGLFEAFNHVTQAYVQLQAIHLDLDTAAIRAFSNDALDAMLRALLTAPESEVSFRLTSLDGLVNLCNIRGLLSEKEVGRAIQAVTDIVLHQSVPGHGNIRGQAIKALTDLAHSCPDVVRNKAFPAFMVELPDVSDKDANYAPTLEAFAQLSSEQQIFDTIALRLKNKISAARSQPMSLEYQKALLLAMLYAFMFGSPMLNEDGNLRSEYYTDYAQPLVSNISECEASDLDKSTLQIVGRICNITLRAQGAHFQSSVYHRNLGWMTRAFEDVQGHSSSTNVLTPFILYYYAALRPEVVDAEDVISMLRTRAGLAISGYDHSDTSATLRHISLMVNKFLNPQTMEATLRAANIEVVDLLGQDPSPHAINVAFAVVKALLVQGKTAALTSRYIDALLRLLPSSNKTLARLFATLVTPDDILTKENHCLVSSLYKQKLFHHAVPHITEAVCTAEPTPKINYLIALSGILRWLPYSVIEPSLRSLVPPLLQTLTLSDAADQDVKASALTIFESVLMHDPSRVAEHIASLVTRLLNSTMRPTNNASVRSKALQCLALAPRQLKREAVVPYRRQVVKRLLACLDDPKRIVRAEAVKCRTAWLGLDEGTDDNE